MSAPLNIYKLFRKSVTSRRWDRVDAYVAIAATPEEALYSHAVRLAAFESITGMAYDEEVNQELEAELGLKLMPLTPAEAVHYNLEVPEWEVTWLGQATEVPQEIQVVCVSYCER